MKILICAAFIATISLGTTTPLGTVSPAPIFEEDVVEHGGGCRKSSPPGLCCHMDNRTGTVHCH